MKILTLALLLTAGANAQSSLSFLVNSSSTCGQTGQPIPAACTFPDTPVGQTASFNMLVRNTGATSITINGIYVDVASGTSAASSNFFVVGFQQGGSVLAAGASKPFSLNFSPAAVGAAVGYLQVIIAGTNGTTLVSTLSGNGLASGVSLTCTDSILNLCDGKTSLQPDSSLLFGDTTGVALGGSHSITFQLTNNTAAAIPRPTISTELYAVAPFASTDLASLPASIPAGATAAFSIVFYPQPVLGPSGYDQGTLTVGSAKYTLQGKVLIVENNRPPDIQYNYGDTYKPCQACSGYTINIGPLPDTLSVLFVVMNTEKTGTLYADTTLPALPAAAGAGFTTSTPMLGLSDGSAPAQSVPAGKIVIQPGYSLTFVVKFTGSAATTGTLDISYTSGSGASALTGKVSYTLNAQPAPAVGSAQSDLPGVTLMCGTSPCASQTFSSQQQVQATLQVNAPTTAGATLTISFKSLVGGATDPAVTFIAPVTQTSLNFSFTPVSVSGMLSNSQPQFTFQTGTTAGAITFTLTDSATLQTITLPPINILPSKVQIISSKAVRQTPNLILTITGYDNTYSVGPLSFTFTDVSGKLLTPSAIQVDATSNFKQYFFGNNQAGGAFALQVTFPVAGDVTQVGSVTANLTNSSGQASTTQAFQ